MIETRSILKKRKRVKLQKYAINCYETAITYQKHYFQSNYKGKLEYKKR